MRISINAPAETQRGSMLVALLAILMLFGASFMAGSILLRGGDIAPDEARIKTSTEMEHIADQIAAYVHAHNRLPCPVPATTSQDDANFGVDPFIYSNACPVREGLLPFHSLGLARYQASDAWGHFYTYGISPSFADVNTNPTTDIYGSCRLAAWTLSQGGGVYKNINAPKARFCCPATPPANAATADIIVADNGGQIDPSRFTPGFDRATGEDMADVDVRASATPPASIEAFAYALVSHGINGYGAYLVNGTANRTDDGIGTPSSYEIENADGDNEYAARILNLSPTAQYFDDLTIYRTQFGTFSELKTNGCRLPY
ncbi:MAG: hypothetical protein V4621_02355 [Pseudomonadota bacterium]